MKRSELIKDLRALSVPELRERGVKTAEELMKRRFRHKTGQLEQTHRLNELRKEIARVETVLEEKGSN